MDNDKGPTMTENEKLIEEAKRRKANTEQQAVWDIQAELPRGDMDWDSVRDAIYDAAAKLIVAERNRINELAAALEAADAENAKLREIVSKLPLTKDGVPIVQRLGECFWKVEVQP